MATKREISSRSCEMSDTTKAAQKRMFDLAERRAGMTLKVLHLETDIPTGTLKGWIDGRHIMGLDGFVAISAIKGFPNELLSLPFDAASKSICDSEPEETDLDALAKAALDVLSKYVAARHPESPGGIRIVHSEEGDIRLSAAGYQDKSGKVAA